MWKIKLSLSFGQANFCSGSVVLVNVADRDDLSLKKNLFITKLWFIVKITKTFFCDLPSTAWIVIADLYYLLPFESLNPLFLLLKVCKMSHFYRFPITLDQSK